MAVSESSGCRGCVVTFEWTYDDGTLTLSAAPLVTTPNGEREIAVDERFRGEGAYQRQQEPTLTTEAAAATTVSLRFANPLDFAPPQLLAFVVEVQRLSDESIEFEWLPDYGVDPATGGAYSDAEATIVADLDGSGLAGITVLPGPLRRVTGVEHRLATPADFEGRRSPTTGLRSPEATMTALVATSVPGASGLPLDGLDGVLAQFQAIVGNGYHTEADSVAAQSQLLAAPAGDRDERRVVRGPDAGAAGRAADRRRQRRRRANGGIS